MSGKHIPFDSSRFCAVDIGSTTTKAILFRRSDGWEYVLKESPTTVEKPYEDVSIGVLAALRSLEETTGEKLVEKDVPSIPLIATSSAGGGLAIVVAGLVREVTSKSAERVALGAGAIIQDVIALDDGRTPYAKIEVLRNLRPDMLLLAGGFDDGAIYGPVFLAEIFNESNLKPKLSTEMKLPVIYAGNASAMQYVREILADRFVFCPVDNVRPEAKRENLKPARSAIHDVFMDHVMSRAPGYESFREWVCSTILPTPSAVGQLLALVSRETGKRILAVDIGGATTDVFTADSGKVFRTVSANLGMSYSILNVAEKAGIEEWRGLIDPEHTELEFWDRVGNKYIWPTTLPEDTSGTKLECAVASIAIRESVRQHFEVMSGVSYGLSEEELGWNRLRRGKRIEKSRKVNPSIHDYDMIIGSGGKLSHSPRETTAMILLNALEPKSGVELAVDSVFMFPHLGAISKIDESLALQLYNTVGVVNLGQVVAPTGRARKGDKVARLTVVDGNSDSLEHQLQYGDVQFVRSEDEAGSTIEVKTRKLKLQQSTFELSAGDIVIFDGRGRPSVMSSDYRLPVDYRPEQRDRLFDRSFAIQSGELIIERQLAIPGDVLVEKGDDVTPESVVAKSVKSFLRPFFLDVTRHLRIEPDQLEKYFFKKVGDTIESDEIIAERKSGILGHKVFRSSVSGVVEKILPNGTVVVREQEERIFGITSVNVAKEFSLEPEKAKLYIKCEPGDELEKGQIIAKRKLPSGAILKCESPIRGRVTEVNTKYGVIIIEPLREELNLEAWVAGTVDSVSDRGCRIRTEGTRISGEWGRGGELFGRLSSVEEAAKGAIAFAETIAYDEIQLLSQKEIACLITGGMHMFDLRLADPDYAIVVTDGFGDKPMREEIFELLRHAAGLTVSIDANTQLRAGVKRPEIIIPRQ